MLSRRTTKLVLLALGGLAFCAIVVAQRAYFRWSMWGEGLAIGLQFSTFFGLIVLAAAWTAVGSPRGVVRIGQSMVLCTLAVLATLLNGLLAYMPSGELPAFAGVVSLVAIGQWLLVVSLLWPLMAMRHIRLRHIQDLSAVSRASNQQFAIREILIVTAVAAIFLGAIRWWILSQHWVADKSTSRALFFFGYLAVCNILVSTPLLVAPLLCRHAIVSTLIALAFVTLVTVCEIAVWFGHIGPTPWIYAQNHRIAFWTMNSVQAIWVLLALGVLRAGGYRLSPGKTTNESAAIAVNKADQW